MKKILLFLIAPFLFLSTPGSAQVDYGSCQVVTSGSPCFFGLYMFWIKEVKFGTLDFTTGNCSGDGSDDGYQDLYSSTSGTVTAGNKYTLTITKGGNWGDSYMMAWCDWNNDGDFDDPGEQLFANAVFLENFFGSSVATIPDIQVPANAVNGEHRLRIRSDGSAPATNPCATSGLYGDTKDFKLIVEGGGGNSCDLSSDATSVNSNCGNSSGSVSLNLTGGTAPYTYNWSNGATTNSISNLSGGTYSATVTDANGCTATSSAIVTEPQELTISSAQVNATCNGSSTGSIQLLVTGGTSPYSYNWSNGSQNKDLSNLTAGSYSVTVTDANGCTEVKSINITEPLGLSLSETHSAAGCDNASGSIDLTVEGGTAPYTYLWSNSAVTQDLSGLSAGDYSVVVTDINGCTAAIEVTVESTSSACGVPSGIQATDVTSGTATVIWDAQPCAYRFHVRYSVFGSGNWINTPTEVGSNTKRLTNLIAGTEYEIQVRANCSSGVPALTKWSNSEYFTTKAACTAPTGVTATNLRKTRATIMWDAMSGAYSYEVRYRETGDTSWKRRPAVAPATSKILINLIAGSQYEYQVRSICDVSGKPKSEWSDLQTFNTTSRLEELVAESGNEFNVFPNPGNGKFNIQIESSKDEKGKIEIFNVLGENIFSMDINLTEGQNNFRINLSHSSPGIYLLNLKSGDINQTQKISISK